MCSSKIFFSRICPFPAAGGTFPTLDGAVAPDMKDKNTLLVVHRSILAFPLAPEDLGQIGEDLGQNCSFPALTQAATPQCSVSLHELPDGNKSHGGKSSCFIHKTPFFPFCRPRVGLQLVRSFPANHFIGQHQAVILYLLVTQTLCVCVQGQLFCFV